jgi:hypothetical protein
MGHRRGTGLPGGKRLFRLSHFGALQVPDFGGEFLQ